MRGGSVPRCVRPGRRSGNAPVPRGPARRRPARARAALTRPGTWPAWARAAPLGLGEAASLLVRPHRLGQRARSRPRVASDGRASLPPGHVGGRVRPRRRGRRTPAATVCTARGSLSPGREDTVALRLRPASSRTRRAHTPGVSRLCHCRVAGRHPSSSAASGRDAWLHWRASHLAEVTLSLSRTLMRNRRKRPSQLTWGGGEAATPQQVLVPSPPCGLRRL